MLAAEVDEALLCIWSSRETREAAVVAGAQPEDSGGAVAVQLNGADQGCSCDELAMEAFDR